MLAGKYRVERVLGRGGMGIVVEVTNLNLDARVALKFLHPQALENPVALERFQREARAAARIKNPHIAQVLDVDALPTGVPYIVMEYLEGRDLEGWLRERGTLPVEEAVGFVLQACSAIAEAHRVGIIHRDIKPANLFVTQSAVGAPFIKVLDFGISKIIEDTAQNMTKTKAFVGSPLYMSPEQMKSARNADARSDIWSLGAVLFELLTGDVPYRGETIAELAVKVALSATPSVTERRSDVPDELERAIHKCLAKEPGERYSSVAELVTALLPFAPYEQSLAERPSNSPTGAPKPQQEASPKAQAHTAALPAPEDSLRSADGGTESTWTHAEPPVAKTPRRWPIVAASLFFPAASAVLLTQWSGDRDSDASIAATATQSSLGSADIPTTLAPGAPLQVPPATAAAAASISPPPVVAFGALGNSEKPEPQASSSVVPTRVPTSPVQRSKEPAPQALRLQPAPSTDPARRVVPLANPVPRRENVAVPAKQSGSKETAPQPTSLSRKNPLDLKLQ